MSDDIAPYQAPIHSGALQPPHAAPTPPLAVPADILKRVTRQRAELAERYKQPGVIKAACPGTCRACHRRYQEGDDIALLGTWVHLACAVCVTCNNWVDVDDIDQVDVAAGFHLDCQPTAPTAGATR